MNTACCSVASRHAFVEPLESRISPASLIGLIDSDGDRYTIKLAGPGTFIATQTNPGDDSPLASLALADTTAKSVLSITVSKAATGDGKVSVGSITGGLLGSLTAPAAMLGSSLLLTGVGSVTLGDVAVGAMLTLGGDATKTTNVTLGAVGDHFVLQSSAKLGAVTAARLGDGTIMAPALASLTAKTGGILADLKITGAVGRITAAGATDGLWMASSFGAVSAKNGSFDADLIATGPLAKKATVASVGVTGGDFTGSVSAVGGIGSISAKASKTVGGAMSEAMFSGASLGTLSAAKDLNADLTITAGVKTISAGGNATGTWEASLFGAIKVTNGSLGATIDATAQIMPVGRTPAIASITVTAGGVEGDITAAGTIAKIAAIKKSGVGGRITQATLVALNFGTITASELDNATILAGAGSVAGPFATGTITKLAVAGDVLASVVGAGLSSDSSLFQDGDDTLIANGAVKAFSISGEASDDSYFAAASFPAAVKINKISITPPADARFFTTGTADTRAPLLSAALAHDTGILSNDGITADASIEGKVKDASAITAFVGGLDGTLPANFTSVLAKLRANGAFTLDLATLETLNGGPLAEGAHTLHLRATDAASNSTDVFDIAFTLTGFQVVAHTPVVGSGEVGVTFHPQIYFSKPVNTATLTDTNFFATFGGVKLDASIVPANDGSFAWLFFDDPMPNSSQVQVTIDGSTIMAMDGSGALDAAGTGVDGSMLEYSFSTVSITPVVGTSLSGRIVDPGPDKIPMTPDDYDIGPDGMMHTSDDVFKLPIAGVKVFIIGLENKTVFTDANGAYRIDDIPAGNVKIVTDGTTATNAPSGFYFPEMVTDAQMVVGQDNEIMPDMREMYLPRVASAILKNVSAANGMMITADANGAGDLTPAQRARLTIDVPANSFIDENGQSMATGMVGVSTVPGSLVMEMLPAGILEHSFDITVQAPGITKFSTPAPMTVPNVFNAPAGTKLNFLSFDHTTGRLVIEGTGTVTADGLMVTTDPGYGITHPGWHAFTQPGSDTGGPDGAPPPPPPKPCEDGNDFSKNIMDFTAAALKCAEGLSGVKGFLGLAANLPGQIYDLQNKLSSLQNALNSNNDSATAVAAFQTINSLKKTIVKDVQLLADQAKKLSPREKIFAAIKCANDLLSASKKLCDKFANGPCGNPQLQVVCLGLGVIQTVVAEATGLIDAVEKVEKDLIQKAALITVCTTLDFVSNSLGIVPAHAPSENGAIEPREPVSQSVLDAIAQAVTQAGDLGDSVVALGDYATKTNTIQDGLAQLFTDTSVYYNQVHDAAKNSYWMFDYNNFQLRGNANEFGKVNAFLPPKTEFTLTVYDQNSNRLATVHGMTNDAGTPTGLPMFTFLSTEGLTDRDGDGLVDAAEMTIGTDPLKGDSNNDGLSDFAAVQSGLDPLAGASLPTGIVANLPIAGEALKVTLTGGANGTGQTAFVAAGTGGLAIVDASKLSVPVLLSQLALPGTSSDVAVDPTINMAVVAGGAAGVSFVDVSDAMNPTLKSTINVNATQVEAFDGLAYVAVGNKLNAYDPTNGSLIESLTVGSNNITDLVRDGGTLFVMDAANVLTSVDLGNAAMSKLDTLAMPQGGGKLAVAGGVAYAAAANAFNGGMATADVSDPANLALISGSDLPGAQALGKSGIATNGSGLALLVGQAVGQNVVEVLNVSDPQNTASLVASFTNLPAIPQDVAIGAGLAFVADGASGLLVVNYRAFDIGGVAPNVTLASNAVDIDAGTAGVQQTEGSTVRLRVNATDDVQVRAVELLLNGQVIASDVSAPFDFAATLPKLADSTIATLQVRATDTGGNSTISNALVYNLVPDTFAPMVVAKSPDKAGFDVKSITLRFDEAIDASLFTLGGFTLTNLGADGVVGGGDDSVVTLATVNAPSPKRIVLAVDSALPFANYQLSVDPSVISDIAGNHPAAAFTTIFTSYNLDPNTKVWVSDTNGNWNDGANWAGGVVPGANDPVFIGRIGVNVTVTHNTGNFDTVKSLINQETLVIPSGRITATSGTSSLGTITFSGGSFAVSGAGTTAHFDGALTFNSGGILALNGATVDFPGQTSLTTPNGSALIQADGTNSLVDLTGLTTLHGASGSSSNVLSITASNGGKVDLNNITTIPDGSTQFRAINTGSMIDLSDLTTLTDNKTSANSYLSAERATILAPNLTTVQKIDISMDGASANLSTPLITNLNYVRLFAYNGATLDLSNVTNFVQPPVGIQIASADGAGSVINLSGLTTLHGAIGNNTANIVASNGGKVDLHNVTTIPDGSTQFRSINSGAIIDLSALTTFIDDTSSASSYLSAERGTILVPNLVNLTNLDLYKDGAAASLNTTQITNIDTVRLFASGGATLDLSNVASIAQPAFGIQIASSDGAGSVVNLSGLTALHGASGNNTVNIVASNGGKVDLHNVTTIPDGSTQFRSINSGAIIDLSALTTFIDNTSSATSYLSAERGTILVPNLVNLTNLDLDADGATAALNTTQITNIDTVRLFATNGATLDLSNVTAIAQTAADMIVAQANGAGALINLTGLTTLHGSTGNALVRVNAYNGGKVDLHNVTSIPDGSVGILSSEGGAIIDLSGLTTFVDNTSFATSYLSATRASILMPNLVNLTNLDLVVEGATASLNTAQITNIDTVRLFANNGATLDLSNVTAIAQTAADMIVAQANGAGALINLTGLTSLHGSTGNALVRVNAYNGGKVDLHNVTTIPDGSVGILSSEGGAIIDLSGLTTFIDNTSFATSYLSTTRANILMPNLVNLTNLDLVVEGATASLNTAQITNIDTVRLFANNGATLDLSNVTSYAPPSGDVVLAQANGGGALIKLTGLTSLPGSSGNAFVHIRAFNTSTVDLHNVTTVPSGSIQFRSSGANALIDLTGLTSITDSTPGFATSAFFVETGGAVHFTTGTLNATGIEFYIGGPVSVGTLTLGAGSKLFGTSTITGNVANTAGEVRPGSSGTAIGVLTITGSYTQGAAGTLFLEIGGLTAGTQFDRLLIGGAATFAGTLSLSEVNGFAPSVGAAFQVLTYSSATGTFGTITDNAPTRTYTPTYNATNLTLTVS